MRRRLFWLLLGWALGVLASGGGGRYDGLAAEMGAPATPGVGFALGLDRTLMACEAEKTFIGPGQFLQVYVVKFETVRKIERQEASKRGKNQYWECAFCKRRQTS